MDDDEIRWKDEYVEYDSETQRRAYEHLVELAMRRQRELDHEADADALMELSNEIAHAVGPYRERLGTRLALLIWRRMLYGDYRSSCHAN